LARLGKHGLADILALIIAFFVTTFFGVVTGVMAAMSFSIAVFIFNSAFPRTVELHRHTGDRDYVAVEPKPDGVSCIACWRPKGNLKPMKVIRFEAPLWYANSSGFVDRILAELRMVSTAVVLDMSSVPWIDATGATAVKKVLERAKELGVEVAFTSVNHDVEFVLKALCGVKRIIIYRDNYGAEGACLQDMRSPASTSPPMARATNSSHEGTSLEGLGAGIVPPMYCGATVVAADHVEDIYGMSILHEL